MSWRNFLTLWEAQAYATEANDQLQLRLHRESLHRKYDRDEGFIPASKLDSQILDDYLKLRDE